VAFITDDFLLHGETARRLYHLHAAPQPILDYHCHLSPRELAEDRSFSNLFEIWLEGDHYKWRAMRANGVAERYCTGNAAPYEKFLAWARTVPYTLRNPLYHWTHLELQRYFGIDDLLDEHSAPAIWARANSRLADGDLTARGILSRFRVAAVCTTDDPADTLAYHEQLAHSALETAVYPCYRPDGALRTSDPLAFNMWVDRLGAMADVSIATLPHFLEALRVRHDDFHAHGCRLSDHGLEVCPAEPCSDDEAARIFDQVRGGHAVGALESEKFASHLMLFFGRLDAARGWTKQLHLGALRDVNTKMLAALGPNTGFDSIGDWPQARALGRYLDQLTREGALPKVILYNLNPADNYAFATMAGNFQGNFEDAETAGRIQFGSGWWFLDQKDGIRRQLDALSRTGLLPRFIGMVTDSRSFMSYPRHEYFRRVLCDLVAADVDRGELPSDDRLIGRMVADICYANAARLLELPAREAVRDVVQAFRPARDGGPGGPHYIEPSKARSAHD
jgi:glucuronate isomerase